MLTVNSKREEVTRKSIKAIRPIINKIKNDKGTVPSALWRDEFFLGFIGFLIEQNFRTDLSRSERGFILAEVYGALANIKGADIAKRQTQLLSSNPRHVSFEKGVENASIFMLASIGEFSDRVLPHYEKAKRVAASLGKTQDRNTILEVLFEDLFYDELRQRFEPRSPAAGKDVGYQSETGGPEGTAVLAKPTKSANRARDEAPRPAGRTVRNSSKPDHQPQSDRLPKSRVSDKDLGEANRASAISGSTEPARDDEAEHHIAELEARVQDLRSRGDSWQIAARAASALQARLRTLEGELQQLRNERDSWTSKAQDAQAASDASSQRIGALEGELATLRVERDSWQTTAESARSATGEIRESLSALSSDLDKLRDERDTLAKSADAAQETAADLRQRSATLQADLDQIRGEHESLMAKAEAGERAQQEMGADARALRREIAVNLVVALIFVVALGVVIFSGQLW